MVHISCNVVVLVAVCLPSVSAFFVTSTLRHVAPKLRQSPVLDVVASTAGLQSRRAVLGTGVLGTGFLLAAGAPREAGALCGDKAASWEFWIPWNEELITVSKETGTAKSLTRSVFYRVVGDVKNEDGSKDKGLSINTLTSRDAKSGKRHLVLVVPDKFRDHEYLTTLEALVTSDRRVVLYDAMGTGQSEPLSPEQKQDLQADEGKALAFAVKELGDMWITLQKTLKVDQVHRFAHGFGVLKETFPPPLPPSSSCPLLKRVC
jgi:hypothetical protein